jgi:AraC-like DNA-binding protein
MREHVFEAGKSGVFGVSTRRFEVLLEGQGRVVATKFKPGMFFPFVARSMAELTDHAWSLAEAFGTSAEALEREVLAHADDARSIAVIEDFLRARTQRATRPPRPCCASWTSRSRAAPLTSVEELAREAGASTRTLQRLFERYVGVSPTWVLRRFRMHEAVDRASQGIPRRLGGARERARVLRPAALRPRLQGAGGSFPHGVRSRLRAPVVS